MIGPVLITAGADDGNMDTSALILAFLLLAMSTLSFIKVFRERQRQTRSVQIDDR